MNTSRDIPRVFTGVDKFDGSFINRFAKVTSLINDSYDIHIYGAEIKVRKRREMN